MDLPAFHARTLAAALERAARQFPVLVVTGPRQSGKTTLVRHQFGATHSYCSLDDPIVRRQAESDPNLLLERFRPPLILDEIQYLPDILHTVKADVDRHRGERGRYVITGSQGFALMEGVAESLAGRAAVLALQSLSHREACGLAEGDRAWRDVLLAGEPAGDVSAVRSILRGGFPEPALLSEMEPRLWYGSYLQTYLERDVRALRAVGELRDFEDFLFALASRSGGLVRYSELARDLQLSVTTVKAWISILEASGQIFVLRPYHTNLGKRLVKTPKIFFLDSGLLSYLLGISTPDQVLQGVASGAIFEAAVLGQLYRLFLHRGEVPRIWFWRTSNGHEVDFVVEAGTDLVPVEVKLTATPSPRDARGLVRFQELFGERTRHALLVCLCRERFPLTRTVEAVPFGAF